MNREGAQFTSGGRGCFSLQSSERQSLVRTAPGCHGTGSTSSSPGLAEPRLAAATCQPRFGRKSQGCATLLVLGARPGRMGLFSVIQKHLPCVRPWPAPCIPSLLPSSSSISQTGTETRAGLCGAEGAARGWGEADGFGGSQGGWSGKMRPGWRWPKGGVTRVFSPWPGTPPPLIPQQEPSQGEGKECVPSPLARRVQGRRGRLGSGSVPFVPSHVPRWEACVALSRRELGGFHLDLLPAGDLANAFVTLSLSAVTWRLRREQAPLPAPASATLTGPREGHIEWGAGAGLACSRLRASSPRPGPGRTPGLAASPAGRD